ncbi:22313_t:CDS:2 [Dentiscutata erythropus]|uniref:22313_t:CDS:1 n=1 Tax=Dentiscutata erythropus TaxID=1348616 RepID=A0A9N9BPU3_9GLOM|nr:22313_t:CDS:2 [Dentiscutata erythropus]
MKSREALLNLATLEIIVPNGIIKFTEENIDTIFNKKSRTIAFYDEQLCFYLLISLPHDSGISDLVIAKAFFQQLEINVEASMVDASNLSVPAPPAQSIYRYPPGKSGKSRSSSATTSPSIPGTPTCSSMYKNLNKASEGTVIYSNTYNLSLDERGMMVTKRKGCWNCVIPLNAPIVLAQSRAHSPALSLSVSTSLLPLVEDISKHEIIPPTSESYAAHHFGKMNLLAGLNDDPAFGDSAIFRLPSTRLPGICNEPKRSIYPAVQSVKRSCRKMLNVKSALSVQLRTTNVSPLENTILVSVVLANNSAEKTGSFVVESIKMNIPHGFVTKYELTHKSEAVDEFPMTLHPVDQATFLYNVTVLEKPPLPKTDPPQHCPTPSPNSCVSSRRNSVASIFSNTSFEPPPPPEEDQQRSLSVIIKGSPIFEGEKISCIESEWSCTLDLNSLLNNDDSLSPNKLSRSNQRTLSLTSKFRSLSSASSISSRSSLYLPTGITTPTVSRNFYSAMMNGYINKQINVMHDNESLYSVNGILSGGRTMIPKSPTTNIENSVVMSFFVNTNIIVGQVFTIQVYIVNKSSHVQNLAIIVPNKKRPNESAVRILSPISLSSKSSKSSKLSSVGHTDILIHGNPPSQIEPFMEETEYLKKYFDVETPDADIVCLENNVRVGPLNPSSSEYVTLHFIAVKESLHVVELIQVVNTDTGFITNLRNVLEVLVSKDSSSKNENNYSDVIMKKQVIVAE